MRVILVAPGGWKLKVRFEEQKYTYIYVYRFFLG